MGVVGARMRTPAPDKSEAKSSSLAVFAVDCSTEVEDGADFAVSRAARDFRCSGSHSRRSRQAKPVLCIAQPSLSLQISWSASSRPRTPSQREG